MGAAVGYKCHPCTPYKREESGGSVVPNAEDISPIDGLSQEQIFILCKDYDHYGQKFIGSSTATSAFTTIPTTITTSFTTTITNATGCFI